MLNSITAEVKCKVGVPVTSVNLNLNKVNLITSILAKAVNKCMSCLTICTRLVTYRSTVLFILINNFYCTILRVCFCRKCKYLASCIIRKLCCGSRRSLLVLLSCLSTLATNSCNNTIKNFSTSCAYCIFCKCYTCIRVSKLDNLSLSKLNLTTYRVSTSLKRKKITRDITRRTRASYSLVSLNCKESLLHQLYLHYLREIRS